MNILLWNSTNLTVYFGNIGGNMLLLCLKNTDLSKSVNQTERQWIDLNSSNATFLSVANAATDKNVVCVCVHFRYFPHDGIRQDPSVLMNIFYSRGDRAETAAESLSCIVGYLRGWWDMNLSDLHRAAQRTEFKAGHPGAKLAAGPAEEHQPVTTCILLLTQSPPPSPNITTTLCPSPPPATNPSSSSNPLWQASSASWSYPSPTLNISPVHLSCPSNSMWRQQCGLSCEHPFHSVAVLQSSRFFEIKQRSNELKCQTCLMSEDENLVLKANAALLFHSTVLYNCCLDKREGGKKNRPWCFYMVKLGIERSQFLEVI